MKFEERFMEKKQYLRKSDKNIHIRIVTIYGRYYHR